MQKRSVNIIIPAAALPPPSLRFPGFPTSTQQRDGQKELSLAPYPSNLPALHPSRLRSLLSPHSLGVAIRAQAQLLHAVGPTSRG